MALPRGWGMTASRGRDRSVCGSLDHVTSDDLHRNAQAVVEAARREGVELEVSEFPDGTRTAKDAAAAIGVDVSQIVKSLVFQVGGNVVIALVSGHSRVDEALLSKALDGGRVSKANADAVREATGFPIGGVPPFGHRTRLPVVLDRDLLGHDVVWAAAGTPRHSFPITPSDLQRLSGGAVADIVTG